MRDKIREHIIFAGRVQGVGFRYKVSQLAGHYGLTGWARNEYDGTVTAELQGLEEEIDSVIQALGQDRYIRLERVSRKRMEPLAEERGFHVRS